VAVDLIDEAVAALGAALASAVALLDIPLVVIGGGLADRLGPAFVARVEQAVLTEVFPKRPGLRVVPAALGDRGGAIGAALVGASLHQVAGPGVEEEECH
jgi:glucokinase